MTGQWYEILWCCFSDFFWVGIFSGFIMYRKIPWRKANRIGVFYFRLVKQTSDAHFNTVNHFTLKSWTSFSYGIAASGFRGPVYQSCRKLSLHTFTLATYDYGSASSLQMLSSHPVCLRWDQLAGERWAYQTPSMAIHHLDSYWGCKLKYTILMKSVLSEYDSKPH